MEEFNRVTAAEALRRECHGLRVARAGAEYAAARGMRHPRRYRTGSAAPTFMRRS